MIAELLGHADLSTTDIYAKSDLSMKRRGMERFRNSRPTVGSTEEFWRGDKDIIRRLYGLAQHGLFRTKKSRRFAKGYNGDKDLACLHEDSGAQ